MSHVYDDTQPPEGERDGWKLIFRPCRTLPNGTVLWARNYGLRAWPIWVRVG